MSAVTVYIPKDSASIATGADRVASKLLDECRQRGLSVSIVRNGSRGMFWLEPLIEVSTPFGRIAYGPVSPQDVPGLLDSGMLAGLEHPLRLGITEEIPYLAKQERLTFVRLSLIHI